jgi:uncharacterized protein (TIGR04255 family)
LAKTDESILATKYQHPIVLEAVVELNFPPSPTWTISSFGEFASLAKKHGFQVVKEANQGFQLVLPVGTGGPPAVSQIANRIQTWNSEGTQLWQASADMFAANRRAPYKGWTKFRPHILKGLELYRQLANPTQAGALVMQYINRFALDKEMPEPSDAFLFVPPKIKYGDTFHTFLCQSIQQFTSQENIAVTTTRDLSVTNGVAVVLDIRYTIMNPNLITEVLVALIDNAHARISEAFESSITDKLRERIVPEC